MEFSEDIIQFGDRIIIKLPSGNIKVVSVSEDVIINFGKFGKVNCNALVGKFQGIPYEIVDVDSITPVDPESFDTSEDIEQQATNQDIQDTQASQTLSHEEIEKLKNDGLEGKIKGEVIIQKVIESHANFDKKSEFSKAKYIRRKITKYMKIITPFKSNIKEIANYFFNNSPGKIRFIRNDSLAILSNICNVRANSNVLVVDNGNGLITAALLERMGGYGKMVVLHESFPPPLDAIRYMNFPESITQVIRYVAWNKLLNNQQDYLNGMEEVKTKMAESELSEKKKVALERGYKNLISGIENMELLQQKNFDSLVISSDICNISLIKLLTPYLTGSAKIAIFSPYKEALLPTFSYLKEKDTYLNAELFEPWLRRYQVLPGRMHPQMRTSGGGGFILSATRVLETSKAELPNSNTVSNGVPDVLSESQCTVPNPSEQGNETIEPCVKRQRTESP